MHFVNNGQKISTKNSNHKNSLYFDKETKKQVMLTQTAQILIISNTNLNHC